MVPGKPCVLLIGSGDDDLHALLAQRPLEVVKVVNVEAAAQRLDATVVDAVLIDLRAGLGVSDVETLAARWPEIPVVACGWDAVQLMREILAAGAAEYVSWPLSAEAVALAVDAALARSQAGMVDTPRVVNSSTGMLGVSRQLAAVKDTIERVANGTATALVRGETGTGKELVARAIHSLSPRRAGPFLKVHAPALPDSLLESELFGYEKGAFTGANSRKAGRVELAQGGTLFLDEIGEVSPTMQAKLLRLIQDREYERLGGTRTQKADVRFVAATHRDLEDMVAIGTFREDLFYRLNVVTVWVPPLRARRDDILPIARHYLGLFGNASGKPTLSFDENALRLLQAQRWPGNVRQLVNYVERVVVLARDPVISEEVARRELDEQVAFMTQAASQQESFALAGTPKSRLPAPEAASLPSPALERIAPSDSDTELLSAVRPLREDLRRTEYRAISKALQSAKGNRALAARMLGVSRRTLYTKLEEHGLD